MEMTEDSQLVSCGRNVNEEHRKTIGRKELYGRALNIRLQRWEGDKIGGPFPV